MKIKEVIVLSSLNGTTFTPLLLTYENEAMYLHTDPQGCALFNEDSLEPLYRMQEPILLAQGIMTDSKTAHLVVIKTSGELCYTLISDSAAPQTTLIAGLDVHTTRYRQLFLLPKNDKIHIFYAYSHQATPHLWRIEHRYWDGASWQIVHLGEVLHLRDPLYHVNLDSEGNLHLLTMTLQGQNSLLFTNRFNGAFNIWSSPRETLKTPGQVVDMTALMTSDNVHHLFWVIKTTNGQFELRTALQADSLKLTSPWHPTLAPIETFDSPSKSIGALEINGVVWLLVHTNQEVLMQNFGKGWRFFSSHPSLHRPLRWIHIGESNAYQTYWLEDQIERRAPAYFRELGLNIVNQNTPSLEIVQPFLPQAPPPVPAFYPELISPSVLTPVVTIEKNELETLIPSEAKPPEDIINQISYLEQNDPNLTHILHNMLSKFDQILGVISKNVILTKQEAPAIAPSEESLQVQAIAEIPFEKEIKPFKETLSSLVKENQSLSQALRMMLTKQAENDSSINKLELRISQLQEEKGFLNKWFG